MVSVFVKRERAEFVLVAVSKQRREKCEVNLITLFARREREGLCWAPKASEACQIVTILFYRFLFDLDSPLTNAATYHQRGKFGIFFI